MKDFMSDVRDENHVTAVRNSVSSNTTLAAKWCRVFLGNYARQGEVVEAKREILNPQGLWM